MQKLFINKYKQKYRKLLKEEQTKDLFSLLLSGFNLDEASEVICKANTFNCFVEGAY